MKSVLTPVAKSGTIRINGSSVSIKYSYSKENFGMGTTLTISNEELYDIIKIVKSLEESGLLIKGVSKTIENKAKEQKDRFLRMLLAT